MRRVRRKLRLGLAGVAFAALALSPAAGAAVHLKSVDAGLYPTIRATIVSSAGAGVRPSLTENGVPVVGLEARNLGRAKAVVLAVDRSRSMAGAPLLDASVAARSFVASKPAGDEISVVAFGAGAVALTRPSTSPIDADSALRYLSVDSKAGTSLYDAVALSARQLRAEQLPARVLIVLTDGHDTGSRIGLAGAIAATRAAGVTVYPIGIEGQGFTPAPLTELAQATGGQYYGADSSATLARVYGSIAEALKRTWRLEYVTAARPGDNVRLRASVVGAGSDASDAAVPTFGFSVQGPAAPSKLVPRTAYGPSGPLVVGLTVGGLVLLASFIFFAAMRGSWVRSRIAAHVGETKVTSKQKRKEQRLAALTSVFRVTERAFGQLRQWRRVQRMIEQADVPLKTVEFFWIMIAAAVVLGMVAAVAGQPPLVILALMGAGGAGPFLFIWIKMRRRLRAFENQLPDVLVTIAASLKAGHSFKQGLQAVVDEGAAPASEEFKRVLTETSLGRPMDEALAEMALRAGSKNFEFAITAVTIQRQVGGSLATLFDMVADTVRNRQQFARKVRSLTAMGKMSAYTLAGIPFFLAFAISFLNPGYMSPLFHSHTGHMLVALGLAMMAVGSLFLKKIVSFRG